MHSGHDDTAETGDKGAAGNHIDNDGMLTANQAEVVLAVALCQPICQQRRPRAFMSGQR